MGLTTGTRLGLGYLQDTFEAAAIGLGLISLTGQWIRVNRRLCQKLGQPAEALVGRPFDDMLDLAEDGRAKRVGPGAQLARITEIAAACEGGQPVELRCRRANGGWFWGEITINVGLGADGAPAVFICSVQEMHTRRAPEESMGPLAFADALTGLPNRHLLYNRLDHAISRARRNATQGAVMHINLDGFKAVNERHGRLAGDALLKQAAGRLKRRLREVDTIARVGGDTFIAVLEELHKPEGARIVAGALVSSLARQYDLPGGISVRISGSIGIALFADDTVDAAAIIAEADRALYIAKAAGRSCFRLAHESALLN